MTSLSRSVIAAMAMTSTVLSASELVPGEIESDLVPRPVEFLALLPPGYSDEGDPYPLVLSLHGGGGTRENLRGQAPIWDKLWKDGRVAPMVVVTPSVTKRCFYLDTRDGTQKWETFLTGPFLEHLRERFHLREDREGTMLTGASMGGMGSLRMAFKFPEKFGAVAALEPGIEPVLEWNEIKPKHRFWRDDRVMHRAYGNPIDEEFYAANNPAWIAAHDADRIRDSGLKIFVEAGDEDMYWLYEGTEFLHQVLWDHKIRHQYHLYLGADHIGPSLQPRLEVAFTFLGDTLVAPEPNRRVDAVKRWLARQKAGLDEADHYGNDADLVGKRD